MTSDNVEDLLDSAIELYQTRRLPDADALCRRILDIDPDDADTLNLHGAVLQDLGRIPDSLATLRRALAIDPDFAEAHANLARGLNAGGQSEAALEAARAALRLNPTLAEGWRQSAVAVQSAGRYAEALDALGHVAGGFPGSVTLCTDIAAAAQAAGDHAAVLTALDRVLAEAPDRVDALVNSGVAQIHLGDLDAALGRHRRAAALAPDDPGAAMALARTLHARTDAPGLLAVCEDLLRRFPSDLEAMTLQASALIWLGRFEDARLVCRSILATDPEHANARQHLISIRSAAAEGDDIARLTRRLDDPTLLVMERTTAGSAAAKALEQEGDYDGAFAAFQRVKDLDRAEAVAAGTAFRRADMTAYVDWALEVFTPELLARMRPLGNASDLPVFIVGMPRSGTSLIEQIAASHPAVHGAGERNDIMGIITRVGGNGKSPLLHWDAGRIRTETAAHIERLRALGGASTRVIDKLPDNIQLLGQIVSLFPQARIIVCGRDLRDVCLSCYTNHFRDTMNWTLDQEDCAFRALEVERLMAHWRRVLPRGQLLDVTYETVVGDLEAESRRLINFLGLPWDPACLEFHKTERVVTTASVWQVRQPLYDSSMGRWRRYETHIGPMLRMLARLPRYAPSTSSASVTIS